MILNQPDYDVLYFNDRYINGELDVMFTELNLQFTTEDFLESVQKLKHW